MPRKATKRADPEDPDTHGKRGTAATRRIGSYVPKIAKEAHGVAISHRANALLCALADHAASKLVNGAVVARDATRRRTLTSLHVRAGARAALPLGLGRHAVDAVDRAAMRFAGDAANDDA